MNESVSLDLQFSRRTLWLFFAPFIAIDAVLLVANLFISAGYYMPSFILHIQLDLHRDECFATWFSSFQLALIGGVALLNLFVVHQQGTHWVPKLAWLGMAALMLALSCDEIAGMHEYVERRQNKIAMGKPDASYVPFLQSWTVWLLPVIIGVVAFILFTGWTCLKHSKRALSLCLIAVAIWVGVIVAEYLQRRLGLEKFTWGYAWRLVWEEGGEIVGATMFLIAFTESLFASLKSTTSKLDEESAEFSVWATPTEVSAIPGTAGEVEVEQLPVSSSGDANTKT